MTPSPTVPHRSVTALVLTYNAPDALQGCLGFIRQQTAGAEILVIDNDSDAPVDDIVNAFGNARVETLAENLGPAGGYAAGLTEFLRGDDAWVWIMDDDCRPEPDTLRRQLEFAEGIGRPCVVLADARDATSGRGFQSIGWCGVLVARSVVERVGVPRADLFWWTEDTEYLQSRIPNAGIPVEVCPGAVVHVSRARESTEKPAWKYYYETRNQVNHRLRVQRRDGRHPVPHHLKLRVRTWRALRSVAKLAGRAIFVDRVDRVEKVTMVFRGAFDGVLGRLGKRVRVDTAHRPIAPGRTDQEHRDEARSTDGAVFVMPRRTTEWADARGVWIAVAGWAEAARRRYGTSWVATPEGVFSSAELEERTRPKPTAPRSPVARRTPVVVKTFAKDARRYRRASRYRITALPEWEGGHVEFVWQHHDLFHRAGEVLARHLGCPLVSFVHAPQVWEARAWGVQRPGWGSHLERWGEVPQLLASDVVACVSKEVADEVVRLGVPADRVIVCPTGVDIERFGPHVSGQPVRDRHALAESFVVGWIGSFRSFHGLDTVLHAFARLHQTRPEARLLLVGGGAERATTERLASDLRITDAVVFTGEVSHIDIPEYVAAMDVAVVSAPPEGVFHYSPQKLREYLAAQVATVAPRVGDIERFGEAGREFLVFEPGDVTSLADRLEVLAADPDLRAALGVAGRALVLQRGTWDAQLEHLVSSEIFRSARARCDRQGKSP